MLEPIPLYFDSVAFDTVFDTVFSPCAKENGYVSDLENDQLADFSDPVWDTLFKSFQENATHVDALDLKPLVTVHEPEDLPKLEKRKCEDFDQATDSAKRYCRSVNVTLADEPVIPKTEATTEVQFNLFATPRHTWSVTKRNRYDAMQRLNAKKREGRFSLKRACKYSVRKKLANQRKRTNKGQFARTSKFKWVSVCDLQG